MTCLRCGSTIDAIHDFCPICGSIVQNMPDMKKNTETETVLWETVSARNYPLAALISTIQESFFNSDCFFLKLRNSKHIRASWLYGLISGSFGMIALYLWSVLFPDSSTELRNSVTESSQSLIFTPVVLTFQIILVTLYTHFMLFLTKSVKAPINATFRICSYSLGALILNAIPFFGPIIVPFFWFYLVITGIHNIHQISKCKAALILILPLIVIFIIMLVFIIAVIIGGILVGSISSQLFSPL